MSINVYGVPDFLSICNPDIVFFFLYRDYCSYENYG